MISKCSTISLLILNPNHSLTVSLHTLLLLPLPALTSLLLLLLLQLISLRQRLDSSDLILLMLSVATVEVVFRGRTHRQDLLLLHVDLLHFLSLVGHLLGVSLDKMFGIFLDKRWLLLLRRRAIFIDIRASYGLIVVELVGLDKGGVIVSISCGNASLLLLIRICKTLLSMRSHAGHVLSARLIQSSGWNMKIG